MGEPIRDAVWTVGSEWPEESWFTWGPDPHDEKGQFWGNGHPIAKYRDTLRSPVQKWLNRLSCHLDCDLGMAQGIINY